MEHINIPVGEIHQPHNWQWADQTARLAEVVTDSFLVDRVGLQVSDGTLWRLASTNPVVWAPVAQYEHPASHPPSIITQDATNRFVTDAEKSAWDAKQAALGFTAENAANKATTFATVSHTLYPSVQAVKEYADGLVVGLWDDRGAYDASVNTFPAAGGSGAAGAILKGDIWTVSVAGALGGVAVGVGDTVRAMVDAPAQVVANWSILENNTGYVPENAANKDASGGYPGLIGQALKLWNAAKTFYLTLSFSGTANRAIAFPDKDGTVAMTSDLTAATITNTPAGNLAATNVQLAINELDESVAASTRFIKDDPSTVAFTKTGAGTAEVKAATVVDVDGTTVTFAAATAITMPALTAGTDYAIYACTDGTIRADSSFSAPSGYTTANSRKIGGFHYAPGGNAPAQAGGDTTPAINAYSFWDLKFKPSCPDPRGMALVAGGFWVDIYLTGVDAITNGSSKYNVTVADGSSPPKVPSLFGGNGTTTYGTYTWFEAMEMGAAFGKRCLSQQEFMAAMYGTTEEVQSGGTDVPTTGVTGTGATSAWNVFTSKWGMVQATGCMWTWGLDRGGPYGAASWNANTEGRGSEYNAPNAVLLGGSWGHGASCGSRCSVWNNVASFSADYIGSRFSCDHLQLE